MRTPRYTPSRVDCSHFTFMTTNLKWAPVLPAVLLYFLSPWFSKRGSQTSSINITHELVRNTCSWPHPRPYESETLEMEASKSLWFWGWNLRTTVLVNSLSHSLKIFFTPSHFSSCQQLPLLPHSRLMITFISTWIENRSTQKRTSSYSYIPICLHLQVLPDPAFLTVAGANPPPHLHTTFHPFLLLGSCFPLHGVFPISTQMSLSQRQNKNKPLKISRFCYGTVNHIVMWNFWIFICIFLFS